MKRVIRIVEIVGEDADVDFQVNEASIHGTVKVGKVEITSTTVDNPPQELLDLVKRTAPSVFKLGDPKLIKAGDILNENGVVFRVLESTTTHGCPLVEIIDPGITGYAVRDRTYRTINISNKD